MGSPLEVCAASGSVHTHADLASALTALALTYAMGEFEATVLPYRRSDAVLFQACESEWPALNDLVDDLARSVEASGVELRAGRHGGMVLFALVPVPGSDTAALTAAATALARARIDWPI